MPILYPVCTVQVKLAINIRPMDDIYIFVYDEDQIFVPSYSRIYGSDYRKLSQVK